MKVTIELTDQEVKGIKDYLRETGDESKITKEEIRQYVDNIVHGTIHAPQESVSYFIDNA